MAPGQRLAGKYRVEREIGAGSMGVVVEAWHVELDQRVAIKFLYPEFASNREGAERFRREARASARIESEHVAKVLDIGTLEEGRTLFYVMEFLRGHDLSRELSTHGPLPVKKAVDHVLETCEALDEAHAKGIVHRDLKPANLFLVERPNGEQMVKVVDFGISKIMGSSTRQFSLTDTSIMMGSPAYMCPEQLESSRNVDGRADIWSLGVILHELILGDIPFRGDSVPQLVGSILLGKRIPLTTRPGVPDELEAVVARCLRQNREERFANISELREALLPFSTLGRRPAPSSVPGAVSSSGRSSEGPLRATPVTSIPPAPVSPERVVAHSSQASEPARPVSAPPSALGAQLAEPAVGSEVPPRTGLQSSSDPISWGRTQQGQSWRQAMYRRGLPAVLFATLALGGVYWWLRPAEVPSNKVLGASVLPEGDHPSTSVPRLPGAPPEPVEKPVLEPVIKALQPAPSVPPPAKEPEPIGNEGAVTPPAPAEPPPRPPPGELRAPKSTKPPPGGAAARSPGSAGPAHVGDPDRSAPSGNQDSDTRQNRPGFLRKLEGQDYGGRE